MRFPVVLLLSYLLFSQTLCAQVYAPGESPPAPKILWEPPLRVLPDTMSERLFYSGMGRYLNFADTRVLFCTADRSAYLIKSNPDGVKGYEIFPMPAEGYAAGWEVHMLPPSGRYPTRLEVRCSILEYGPYAGGTGVRKTWRQVWETEKWICLYRGLQAAERIWPLYSTGPQDYSRWETTLNWDAKGNPVFTWGAGRESEDEIAWTVQKAETEPMKNGWTLGAVQAPEAYLSPKGPDISPNGFPGDIPGPPIPLTETVTELHCTATHPPSPPAPPAGILSGPALVQAAGQVWVFPDVSAPERSACLTACLGSLAAADWTLRPYPLPDNPGTLLLTARISGDGGTEAYEALFDPHKDRLLFLLPVRKSQPAGEILRTEWSIEMGHINLLEFGSAVPSKAELPLLRSRSYVLAGDGVWLVKYTQE